MFRVSLPQQGVPPVRVSVGRSTSVEGMACRHGFGHVPILWRTLTPFRFRLTNYGDESVCVHEA